MIRICRYRAKADLGGIAQSGRAASLQDVGCRFKSFCPYVINNGSVEQLVGSPDCKSGSSDLGVRIPSLPRETETKKTYILVYRRHRQMVDS